MLRSRLRLSHITLFDSIWTHIYPSTVTTTNTILFHRQYSPLSNIKLCLTNRQSSSLNIILCQSRVYSRLIQNANKKMDGRKAALRKQVLLIDNDGNNMGSMTMEVAIQLAEAQGMELVDVSKTKGDQQHVCRMMSKKKIWDNKKQKKKEKNIHHDVTQEIKIATVISDHDTNTKIRQMQRIIEKNHKVKLIIEPRLRKRQWDIDELREKEQTKQQELMDSVVEKIAEFGTPLNEPNWQGKNLAITIRPIKK